MKGLVVARHRKPGRPVPTNAAHQARHRAGRRYGSRRAWIATAVVAAGATVAAGQTVGSAAGASAPTPAVALAGSQAPALPHPVVDAATQRLANTAQLTADFSALAGRVAEALRPRYVLPAQGQFTSGFGERWGTTHAGDDIANVIGTPIGSVTDGVVLDAGPASGFGLWVRVQNDDGTIAVYGHVNEFFVKVGQRVRVGEQIATIGNRGASTGPHLHFEVWVNGIKTDPQPWLAAHGVTLA